MIVDQEYRRLRPQYVVAEGAKRHVQNRSKRQFKKAVAQAVGAYDPFRIPWLTIALAILVLIFLGPFGLLLCIIICLFEFYFSRDVLGDKAFCMGMETGT